ncbi:hypothetical protein [Microtetraspora sp. NBRC 13810]|uniref:hypothetical protein n=1 Tax=Microtetraspora sp. NBRC 13810 TaxID=3030990 RepID=UPI002552F537|nr:hypothetical protein [Microtetraspora sp. NBRC 13810]
MITTSLAIGVFGAGAGLGVLLTSPSPSGEQSIRLAAGTYRLDEQAELWTFAPTDGPEAPEAPRTDENREQGDDGRLRICLTTTPEGRVIESTGRDCTPLPVPDGNSRDGLRPVDPDRDGNSQDDRDGGGQDDQGRNDGGQDEQGRDGSPPRDDPGSPPPHPLPSPVDTPPAGAPQDPAPPTPERSFADVSPAPPGCLRAPNGVPLVPAVRPGEGGRGGDRQLGAGCPTALPTGSQAPTATASLYTTPPPGRRDRPTNAPQPSERVRPGDPWSTPRIRPTDAPQPTPSGRDDSPRRTRPTQTPLPSTSNRELLPPRTPTASRAPLPSASPPPISQAPLPSVSPPPNPSQNPPPNPSQNPPPNPSQSPVAPSPTRTQNQLPVFQDPELLRRAYEALGLNGNQRYTDANGVWDLNIAPPGTPTCRDYTEAQLRDLRSSDSDSPLPTGVIPRDSCMWPAFIRWLLADPAPGEVSNWTKFTGLPERNLDIEVRNPSTPVPVQPSRVTVQPGAGQIEPDPFEVTEQ